MYIEEEGDRHRHHHHHYHHHHHHHHQNDGNNNKAKQLQQQQEQEDLSLRTIVMVSSVQSLDQLDRRGGHEGRISRDPLPVFSAGGHCKQFWHGQGCPRYDVVQSAFPLSSTTSPTLQGALKDGFGEAVVAFDMPEPCKFPSLDSCPKNFLWTHNGVDVL